MGTFNSHIFCKVDGGKVSLFYRGSDDPKRVEVDADGNMTNRLAHVHNSVDHHFVVFGGDARFLSFELKHASGKPGVEDFQIPGQTMVDGKAMFSPPVQSFVLRNLNRGASAFEYGFIVQDGHSRIEFDPAVRNLGGHRPPFLPDGWLKGFVWGVVFGVLVTATVIYLSLWARP